MNWKIINSLLVVCFVSGIIQAGGGCSKGSSAVEPMHNAPAPLNVAAPVQLQAQLPALQQQQHNQILQTAQPVVQIQQPIQVLQPVPLLVQSTVQDHIQSLIQVPGVVNAVPAMPLSNSIEATLIRLIADRVEHAASSSVYQIEQQTDRPEFREPFLIGDFFSDPKQREQDLLVKRHLSQDLGAGGHYQGFVQYSDADEDHVDPVDDFSHGAAPRFSTTDLPAGNGNQRRASSPTLLSGDVKEKNASQKSSQHEKQKELDQREDQIRNVMRQLHEARSFCADLDQEIETRTATVTVWEMTLKKAPEHEHERLSLKKVEAENLLKNCREKFIAYKDQITRLTEELERLRVANALQNPVRTGAGSDSTTTNYSDIPDND